ncbi:MAG: type II secretion system protein [Candidatus Gastranaerophilales bacterium]
MIKRFGFTLAEVLITLGIIGVVSALTLPTLFSNYQSEALTKKKLLFESRLEEAMNQMRFHEKLTGYDSVKDFVDELSKYLKINETCDLTNMEECFPSVSINSCDEVINVEDLKTGEDFASRLIGVNDFSDDNVGVIFADGTKAILNYDLNCDWLEPYDGGANRSEAVQCVAMLADVSGDTGKNSVGSDILPVNTSIGVDVDGVCWSISNTSFSAINTCNGESVYDTNCTTANDCSYCDTNYWAGAQKACKDMGFNLPSSTDALALGNYLYPDAEVDGSDGSIYYGTVDEDKLAKLGLTADDLEIRYWLDTDMYTIYGYNLSIGKDAFHMQGITSVKNSTIPVVRCIQ